MCPARPLRCRAPLVSGVLVLATSLLGIVVIFVLVGVVARGVEKL